MMMSRPPRVRSDEEGDGSFGETEESVGEESVEEDSMGGEDSVAEMVATLRPGDLDLLRRSVALAQSTSTPQPASSGSPTARAGRSSHAGRESSRCAHATHAPRRRRRSAAGTPRRRSSRHATDPPTAPLADSPTHAPLRPQVGVQEWQSHASHRQPHVAPRPAPRVEEGARAPPRVQAGRHPARPAVALESAGRGRGSPRLGTLPAWLLPSPAAACRRTPPWPPMIHAIGPSALRRHRRSRRCCGRSHGRIGSIAT